MPAAVWLVIGLLLCAAEVLTLDLVLLMLGAAALATAGAALLTGALAVQLAVLAGTAGVLLVLVRPVARRHLEVTALPSGRDRLRGRPVLVVQEVHEDAGQVRLDGELWRARPYAGGPPVPAGRTAVVGAVEGATLFVYPAVRPGDVPVIEEPA